MSQIKKHPTGARQVWCVTKGRFPNMSYLSCHLTRAGAKDACAKEHRANVVSLWVIKLKNSHVYRINALPMDVNILPPEFLSSPPVEPTSLKRISARKK